MKKLTKAVISAVLPAALLFSSVTSFAAEYNTTDHKVTPDNGWQTVVIKDANGQVVYVNEKSDGSDAQAFLMMGSAPGTAQAYTMEIYNGSETVTKKFYAGTADALITQAVKDGAELTAAEPAEENTAVFSGEVKDLSDVTGFIIKSNDTYLYSEYDAFKNYSGAANITLTVTNLNGNTVSGAYAAQDILN